ncbi:hypothetical protein GQ53DRAFT_46694 [Thozetella sp. PMI_491]|nr:hypothetical protein GQ53DRAFT_46694 [Thozetella sp. PMI_491]
MHNVRRKTGLVPRQSKPITTGGTSYRSSRGLALPAGLLSLAATHPYFFIKPHPPKLTHF